MVKLTGLVVIGLVGASIIDDTSSFDLTPGLWEIERSGDPGRGDDKPQKICYSAEQLKNNPAAPFATPRGDRGPKCTVQNLKMQNGDATYILKCSAPFGSIKANSTGTYSSKNFAMTSVVKRMGRTMKIKVRGKYLGSC